MSPSAPSYLFLKFLMGWMAVAGTLFLYFEAQEGRVFGHYGYVYRKKNPKTFYFILCFYSLLGLALLLFAIFANAGA